MNPEQNNQNVGVPPVGQPPTAQQAQPQMSPPAPITNTSPELPKNKSNKLVFILVGTIITLFVVLALLWFLVFSPSVQANKASAAFMNAATSADIDKLVELNDGEGKGFLEGVIQAVEGDYSLLEKANEDEKYYFLYELTDAEANYARTVVENEDDGWGVTSIVFGQDKLKLIPSESSQETTQAPSAAPTTKAAAQPVCLAQDDYRYMNIGELADQNVTYDVTYEATTTPGSGTFNKTGSILFNPDQTSTASDQSDLYDQWAKFASITTDKEWKFRLAGSTYDSTSFDQAAADLANSRAQAVKDALVSRGVSADRIVIDEPAGFSFIEGQDDFTNALYRKVNLTVDPTCVGSAPSASNSGR